MLAGSSGIYLLKRDIYFFGIFNSRKFKILRIEKNYFNTFFNKISTVKKKVEEAQVTLERENF